MLYVGGWGLHGSDLLQHILQMFYQIGIWGIWRPGQRLGPIIAVPEPPPSGSVVMRGVYLVNNSVWMDGSCQVALHECQHPNQRFPAEHCMVIKRSMLFTSPVIGFNVVAH